MIIGIGIERDWIDCSVEFVPGDGTKKRSRVLLHPTVESLRALEEDITGLVLPQKIAGADFNFRDLVAHIRVDYDERLARIPILVDANKSEDRSLKISDSDDEIDELFYMDIAVAVVPEPVRKDFITSIDEKKLKAFRSLAGSKPYYPHDRHDQANAWGAFSILHFLSIAKPSAINVKDLEALKSKLCEDVYYKIKIQQLAEEQPSRELVEKFGKERKILIDSRNDAEPILVVEDQLDDGWKYAYQALFRSSAGVIGLDFAKNKEQARAKFSSKTKLVLLDVRLDEDRRRKDQLEADDAIDQLGGVILAKEFWTKELAVPIVAATASNKSWTLNALLDKGVSAYWVKEMPGQAGGADHAAQNVIDLCEKLNSTIEWSGITRNWIEAGYSIYKTVNQSKPEIGGRLREKARSVHALLHSAPSPFSDTLAGGLQWNLAFLILFSFMNDLVSWICPTQRSKNEVSWYTGFEEKEELLVIERDLGGTRVYDTKYLDPSLRNETGGRYFPDTDVALELLFRMGLKAEKWEFKKARAKRNGLPLIHGKPAGVGTTSKSITRVSDKDISSLVEVLQAMVKQNLNLAQS